ncbi:profilin [Elysia marginata]|uniref:Profilin n=1 Tax=Elysia marginata TaxID=1093978 RepID=A0AAV4JAA6_9GAST|nr:profilin [Elysia marginata]
MSTTNADVEVSLTKVTAHHHQQQHHHHQQQQLEEEEEEQTAQFSPFSSLPGLAPASPTTTVYQALSAPTPGGSDTVTALEPVEAAVHVTRNVFTIRSGEHDGASYLTDKLWQLETDQGLVTLSTGSSEAPGKQPPDQLTVSEHANDQLRVIGPAVSDTQGSGRPNTQGENSSGLHGLSTGFTGQDAEVEPTSGAPGVGDTGSVNSQHNLEIATPNKHKERSEDAVPEKIGSGQLVCEAENRTSEENENVASISCSAHVETVDVQDTELNHGEEDSVQTRDSFTQTAWTTSSPSVDFYVWEQRRLACNGWGFHTHEGYDNPDLIGSLNNGSLGNVHRNSAEGNIARSADEGKVTPDSCAQRSNTLNTPKGDKNDKTVNFSTQTRSPSIRPSCLRIQQLSRSNTVNGAHQTTEPSPVYVYDKYQTRGFINEPSDPQTRSSIKTSALESDSAVSVSGICTPVDSTSTTPRPQEKTPDTLSSSRSTSILSDSGTSSSVPSFVLYTAKPFANRTQRIKPTCEMAAVSPNHTSTETTPRETPESPQSTCQAPTLKVEYVTKVWDAYISDFLLASDHIKDAAIFDRATATCIAASLGFVITDEEFGQLQRSLSSLTEATRHGVSLQGRRYKTFLADGRRGLMAKGEGRSGCSACQTRTLVLVAVHDHTGKAARCNEEVMRLGDFFWAKGL